MMINDLRYSGYSSSIRLGSHVRYHQDPDNHYRIVALQASGAAIRLLAATDDTQDLLVSIIDLSLIGS